MRLANKSCPYKIMVSIICIFIVSIVYSSFISCKLQVYMSRNGVYTDITPHNWAPAVESFELNYVFMYMHYWELTSFLNM